MCPIYNRGLRRNNLDGLNSQGRVEGVVPVAVEVVREQTDGGHVRVGDLDVGRIYAVVAFGVHPKAGLGTGRRDQLWLGLKT
jgi:hypothetical protein